MLLAFDDSSVGLSNDSVIAGTLAERVLASLGARSVGWLEREAKLPKGYGSYITTGKRRNINQDMMARIAVALGVDHHWLATGVRLDLAHNNERLSPYAAEAMQAFDWSGVPATEYDRVESALIAQHSSDGKDRFPNWWTSEIRRLLRETSSLKKSVHEREAVVADPDTGPSPEWLAAKAARDAKAKKRKR